MSPIEIPHYGSKQELDDMCLPLRDNAYLRYELRCILTTTNPLHQKIEEIEVIIQREIAKALLDTDATR